MKISINGRQVDTELTHIGYKDALTLGGFDPARTLTVVFHIRNGKWHRDGVLSPQSAPIEIVHGMRVEIADTSSA